MALPLPSRKDYPDINAYGAALQAYRDSLKTTSDMGVAAPQMVTADTGARYTSGPNKGNLMPGQSNQSVGVAAAADYRKQLATGTMTPEQQQAGRDSVIQKTLQSSTGINNYTSTDPADRAAQEALNAKYNLAPGTGLNGKPVERDLKLEKTVAKNLGAGTQAQNFMTTYAPADLGNLIEQGKVPASAFNAEELKKLGLTPERLQGLLANDKDGRVQTLIDQLKAGGQDVANAQASMEANPAPTNNKLNILTDALNAKNNYKNQNLGTSDLFKMAGLSGYSVLQQSMQQRSAEMKQKLDSARESLSLTSGAQLDAFNAASAHYKTVQEAYDKNMDRLLKIDEKAKEWEQVQEQMKQQSELDIKKQAAYAELQAKYEKANYSQVKLNNGHVVIYDEKNNTIVREWDENGIQVSGEGTPNTDTAPQEDAPPGYVNIGDTTVKQSYFNDVMGVGTVGGQCGTWASTKSTARKVGNSWAEKYKNIEVKGSTVADGETMPQAGWKLLIPLAVNSDGDGYGHVALVTSYNPKTGDIFVAEANKNLDGVIHTGKYNIFDLQKRYKRDDGTSNFGFVKGQLKSQVASQLSRPETLLDFNGNNPFKTAKNAVDKYSKDHPLNKLSEMGLNVIGDLAGSTKFGQGVNSVLNSAGSLKGQNLAIPEGAKYSGGYSPEYYSQISPYLIQNPANNTDSGVNAIIAQQDSPESYFSGRDAKTSAARIAAKSKILSIIPDFNFQNSTRNAAIVKRFDDISTRVATNLQNAEGRVRGELENLQKLSKDYPRNGVVALSKAKGVYKYETNDPKYVAFVNAINTTADSYAALMKNATGSNAGTTDAFLEQALKMIDPNLNDAGLNAQIGQIMKEMENRSNGVAAMTLKGQLLPVSQSLPIGSDLIDRASKYIANDSSGGSGDDRATRAASYIISQGKPASATNIQKFLQNNPNF